MNRTQIQIWKAQADENLPTWRDGLNGSDRTYMILAVPHVSRTGYKAIVYGRYGGGSGKLKFYPTPEACGIDRRSLTAMGIGGMIDRSAGGASSGYVRYFATLEQVKQLLDGLEPSEWAICPKDQIHDALVSQLGRDSSRARHPEDGQFNPQPEAQDVKDEGGLASLGAQDNG